jgi:putative restriction endonuclease
VSGAPSGGHADCGIQRFFPDRSKPLRATLATEQLTAQYQRQLEGLALGGDVIPSQPKGVDAVRDQAFRRSVISAYDYRCAASGWRVITPEWQAMVEAAHLKPFADYKDDDPRNGMALSPIHHWAFDRRLIAPGPDMLWHVSKRFDRRVKDNEVLVSLDNQPILLPRDSRFAPREDALAYCLEELKQADRR